MAILTASSLSQSFGAMTVFSGVSVGIPRDGKIGLVGPNGVGKTTLLLILAGLAKSSTGSVHWARGSRLGYLPQEAAQAFAGQAHTVFDEMLSVFADLRREEASLREMEEAMAGGSDTEELFARYSQVLEQFELAGGYDYETRIKQVLEGLGFSRENWNLPLPHLSGGQKTRVLLARLLLEKPDLLILDEPTNHLDVGAIEWLEGTLKVWDGAILLVSHDRYFLNKVVNTVWEMNSSGVESYRGNYNAYVQQRQERWLLRQQEFDTQKERLEKELDYIRRHIAGQRTQMAKGKLSRISRELDAIQRGGWEATRGKSWSEISDEVGASRHMMSVTEAAEAIKSLQRPNGGHRTMHLRLRAGRRSGNIVLRSQDLEVGYPGTSLFAADNIELHRQECAALIGPNGTGKTTFLRTITGRLEPLAGQVELGAGLKIGYFAQAHEQLKLENSVLDELTRHHQMMISEARDYLAKYLFFGDDVFKPVSSLSGGERGRLALAILAQEGANFLLLDEPTNHLDIPAQETLQEVLEQFDGTILLVSHDRYLVDRLASQIWELRDGRLHVFNGSYQELLAEREKATTAVVPVVTTPAALSEGKRPQLSNNELKKRAERLARMEQQINELEARLAELSDAMQQAGAQNGSHDQTGQPFDKIQRLGIEYTATERRLEELITEWEKFALEQVVA
jgi:ATP-binding cassette, subfamily F, member 3